MLFAAIVTDAFKDWSLLHNLKCFKSVKKQFIPMGNVPKTRYHIYRRCSLGETLGSRSLTFVSKHGRMVSTSNFGSQGPWFSLEAEFSSCLYDASQSLSLSAWYDLNNVERDVKHQGPVVQSVVSLTSSLRVISLTVLADSIYNILIFFAEKMWVAFALQKLLTFFQQKISAYLRITWCKILTNR